jgi:glycine/D-amino acid oxidase-like deaminating enzyme
MAANGADESLYGSLSYWRDSAGPRARFDSGDFPDRCDVAIVGAGFHGLWTAYHLLRADVSAKVVLLDQHHVGFGATGRNGGFATAKIGLRVEDLEKKYGAEPTRLVLETMASQIDALVATTKAEGIECELDYSGLLVVAANRSQAKRVQREVASMERIGLTGIQPLSGEELRQRLNSPTYVSGRFDPHCAILHPLKLARGLAARLAERGVRIVEDAPVTRYQLRGEGVELTTPRGRLLADRCVLTTNSWASEDPRFRRTLVPVYTYILMTEPIDDSRLASIGWEGREGVEDTRLHLHFYRRTRDGRILWGGSDNRVPLLGRIDKRFDKDPAAFQRLESTFLKTFPTLAGITFTHKWGGTFAVTPDFNPHYGTLEHGRILYGHGCCGHGVGPSYLGAQILRDRLLGRHSSFDELLFMRADHGAFPPEPFRSIGASLTLQESRWYDDAQDSGKKAGKEPLLLRLAPKWFG